MFFNFLNQVIDKTFNQKLSSKIIVIDLSLKRTSSILIKKPLAKTNGFYILTEH